MAKTKRPRGVTITLLGVILLGTWSAARAGALARQIDLLVALETRPDPRLLLIIASLWAILFWGAALALFFRRTSTRWLIPLLVALYALYALSLEGLFESSAVPAQGWLLRILLYDGIILFVAWSLNRKEAKSYFAGAQPASLVDDRKRA
jgi:hypothetical protein